MSVATTNLAAIEDDRKESVAEYNFPHFRSKHLLLDAWATLRSKGVQPGELAPDFTMPISGGGWLTLSQLRDQPGLLHFGSFT